MQFGIVAGTPLIFGMVCRSGARSDYDFYSEKNRSKCHENPEKP
jgi:hypothetical protein